MPQVVATLDELRALVDTDLPPSEWLCIDQDRIDLFADVTNDHQWIHVDPDRAAKGPFGACVAHGYLTLALVAPLLDGMLSFPLIDMGVNYGVDRVRFPAPVPAGSRVRAHATIRDVSDVGNAAVQVTIQVSIEIERGSKPACVADVVCRYYGLPAT